MNHGRFCSVFENLAGQWLLRRVVSDGARFEGSALFEPLCSDQLLLRESGELVLAGGRRHQASNCWRWRLAGEAHLEVHFAGRNALYHSLALRREAGGWFGSACHPCGVDRYEASYEIGQDRIGIVHRIAGPRKCLTVNADFARADGWRDNRRN
jgi:hypothetical protein